MLKAAQYFATHEHVIKRGQLYDSLPYTHHLAAVEDVLRRFGIKDEALLVAAWLHDVIEDCPEVKYKNIVAFAGERVADLVWSVTDEPGDDRRAKKAVTYEKTRSVPGGVTLKLADRIANVEHGGPLVAMYRKEYESFRRALYTVDSMTDVLWAHLDSLLT